MTKRKPQPIEPETVVNPVQVLHMDAAAAEAVGAFIDYRKSISDPVNIQAAMRLLIKRGWASIAAAQTLGDRELARERKEEEGK